MMCGNDSLLSAKLCARYVTKLPTKPTKNYIYNSEAKFEPILIQYMKLLCSNGKLNQLKATQLYWTLSCV